MLYFVIILFKFIKMFVNYNSALCMEFTGCCCHLCRFASQIYV